MATHFERPVTPAQISPELRRLIDRLVPTGEPVYVDVAPLDDASADDCFPLVDALVAQHGGESVIGWSLWEFPTLFVEAEFHAVWRMPDGSLIDKAPKQSPTQRVLFLADPARTYDGHQVNNVRSPLRPDPVLLAYLDTFDAQFELLNRGDRLGQHGMLQLVDADADAFYRIQGERAELHLQLLSLFPAVGPYHPCPCGSGLKARWCHRNLVAR